MPSYLSCRLKAHLKLAGKQGTKSEYEEFLLQARREVRRQAISKIHANTSPDDVLANMPLTATSLRAGPSYMLDAVLADGLLSLRFDGLKKVDGPSDLGDFHYVPMLVHDASKLNAHYETTCLAKILQKSQHLTCIFFL